MRYIDYGLGVFHGEALQQDIQATDLADVYAKLLQSGELAAMEVHERFYEIGSPAGLQEMSILLSKPERGKPRDGASDRAFDQNKFTKDYLAEAVQIISKLDVASIEKAASILASTRHTAAGNRLFYSRRPAEARPMLRTR